jgi:endonuclease YncB( thermonuclease family)
MDGKGGPVHFVDFAKSRLDRVASARHDDAFTGRIYVIDGDTFGIGGRRIRVLGMDAPETHPSRCAQETQLGLAATRKLRQVLGSGMVTMSGSGHDQYRRELHQVFVKGVDVADSMIGAGLARS